MKLSLTISIVFLLVAVTASGQTFLLRADSISHRLDSLAKNKLSVFDSIEFKRKQVFGKANALPSSLAGRIDSIGGRLSQPLQRVNDLQQKGNSKIDSVNTKIGNALTIDQPGFTKDMAKPIEAVTDKLDAPGQKVEDVKQKVSATLDKPLDVVNEKLNLLSDEAGGQGNLPSAVQTPSLPGVSLDVNSRLPDLSIPDPKLILDMNAPKIANPIEDTGNLQDMNIKGNLEEKLDGTVSLEKVNELKDNTEVISNFGDKASTVKSEIAEVKGEGIDKAKNLKQDALDKSPVKGELAELQKQDGLMKEQIAQVKSYRNPEEFRKQTLERGKKLVATQLAAQQATIKEATVKLTNYQNKATTLFGKKNELPKKRDTWRRVKKAERFVPGLTLQTHKPGGWVVDINPSFRYRLTVYWSIGAGWNQRVTFGDIPQNSTVRTLFGPRGFSELLLFKGFSLRIDSEMMNTVLYTATGSTVDVGTDVSIWNHMIGLKKDFTFVPRVLGNVQFMYKIYSSENVRIYPAKYNVRFGFEFPLRKKSK